MKYEIILTLGSNHQAGKKFVKAGETLKKVLTDFYFSPIISTGDGYDNQLVKGMTTLDYPEIHALTKRIEEMLGRSWKREKYDILDIDIDILFFDGKRLKLWKWNEPWVREQLSIMEDNDKGYK